MSRYLILLPAPEAEWARSRPKHEKGASHGSSRRTSAGGHSLMVVSRSSRRPGHVDAPRRQGGALVTDGPFTESAEQVVGFYLVETDDEADLRAACERFAARGELIEFRRLAE